MGDNIIIYGDTKQQHNTLLNKVLLKLQEHNLILNRRKCEFDKTQLEFFWFHSLQRWHSCLEGKDQCHKNRSNSKIC